MPILTDAPCGRPQFTVAPAIQKALDRQREMDTGTERFQIFLAQYRAIIKQQEYLADEIETVLEQASR